MTPHTDIDTDLKRIVIDSMLWRENLGATSKEHIDSPSRKRNRELGAEKVVELIKPVITKAVADAVDKALRTERTATLGFSNTMKIDRAIALAEQKGYEKCIADFKRKERNG